MNKLVKQSLSLDRMLPYILISSGLVGLVSSVALGVEKMNRLANPDHRLICDLNPVVSCGKTMDTWLAHAFGIDNSFPGTVAFAALITVGVAMLAGTVFARRFQQLMLAAAMGGVVFIHAFIYTSLYVVHSLCPFCMTIWAAGMTAAWYLWLHAFDHRYIRLPQSLRPAFTFARRYHLEILITWGLLILALILRQFWYYYGPLLGF